ncbi:hypothetical protein SCLCIDRAFT_1098074 [Scleroderma citrinum Foug A]|uniref:Uncharacterized protein n=1 Tax=Scleroderma citrinum Foug A TaxID=1036808 RepID=A0A0C2Z8L4_9AGAM|nr:hypothetical protein SCLCIDRAFT_1098074 [Scleroderma citrinum Foug A]
MRGSESGCYVSEFQRSYLSPTSVQRGQTRHMIKDTLTICRHRLRSVRGHMIGIRSPCHVNTQCTNFKASQMDWIFKQIATNNKNTTDNTTARNRQISYISDTNM